MLASHLRYLLRFLLSVSASTACFALSFPLLLAGSAYGQFLWPGREDLYATVEKTFESPADAKQLSKVERVWVDRKNQRVIVDGYICLREGQLELLACPAQSKEHEAVVALFAKASTVHAALLAAGASAGSPAKWEPSFAPPTGSEIQIQALWRDKAGEQKSVDARQWIRDASQKDRQLQTNWVFAGSGFWVDPDTKEKSYLAESGDLICVSNFSTAALDIPLQSTQSNSGLLFVAYTDRIPELKTAVRLVLQVVKQGGATPTSQIKDNPKPTPPATKVPH